MRVVARCGCCHVSVLITSNTVDGVSIAIWSNLELDISLICACLPPLYPMFRQLTSGFIELTSRGSRSSKSRTNRSKSGVACADYQEGSPDTDEPDKCNYNAPKKGGSFRAWGLNTNISEITSASVVRESGNHRASYIALPDPPEKVENLSAVNVVDVELGTFHGRK